MKEEEKQAIEYWKTHMEILHCNTQIASEHYIKVLLDLVEKQQEEIQELREACNKYNDMKYFAMVAEKYISKDKIKKKIEEITSYAYTSAAERDCQDYAIQVLKKLLGV